MTNNHLQQDCLNNEYRDIVSASQKLLEQSSQGQIIQDVFLRNLSVFLESVSSDTALAKEGLHNNSGVIPSSSISAAPELPSFNELSKYKETGKKKLSKVLIGKLNGGLGTSMGLEKAKSLIPVKDELSFLDIILRQIFSLRKGCDSANDNECNEQRETPLFFLNSFRTVDDTNKVVGKNFNRSSQISSSIIQHRVPRISTKDFLPIKWSANSDLEWCPPGHGDLYAVLLASGVLQKALDIGYQYLFVSNADNLGATLSEEILGYIVEEKVPFLMEVAKRTEVDKKGGHLALHNEQGLILRERAQIDASDEADFQNIEKYKYFNTNTLWIDLVALKEKLEEHDGVMPLPIIANKKYVVSGDSSTPEVIQLETAMGAAISCFFDAKAVVVPRSRFLPVKTTNDLARMQSNIFALTADGEMKAISERAQSLPINLDREFYSNLVEYNKRFPEGLPDLTKCTSFTVKGDVIFGKGVQCIGDVLVENDSSKSLVVEDHSILKGE